jgi:hypothetical protein
MISEAKFDELGTAVQAAITALERVTQLAEPLAGDDPDSEIAISELADAATDAADGLSQRLALIEDEANGEEASEKAD